METDSEVTKPKCAKIHVVLQLSAVFEVEWSDEIDGRHFYMGLVGGAPVINPAVMIATSQNFAPVSKEIAEEMAETAIDGLIQKAGATTRENLSKGGAEIINEAIPGPPPTKVN